jgi:hypothetical protein
VATSFSPATDVLTPGAVMVVALPVLLDQVSTGVAVSTPA